MASNAFSGVGTKFQVWTNAAWSNIAEINSITGPSMSRTTIDVTSLDSTGGYREFITGFRNAGTVSLSMNFTRATLDVMKNAFESNTIGNYRIALPDVENTTIEFEGLVTEMPLTVPMDDKVTMTVTIQISGPVETDSGASAVLGM